MPKVSELIKSLLLEEMTPEEKKNLIEYLNSEGFLAQRDQILENEKIKSLPF